MPACLPAARPAVTQLFGLLNQIFQSWARARYPASTSGRAAAELPELPPIVVTRTPMCPPEAFAQVAVRPELSGASYDAQVLAPEDEWIAKLDHEAFKKDVKALGKVLSEQQGPDDVAHLRKIIRWSRLCSWAGALTMWYSVNPISIYLMSLGIMTRWAIIAHRELWPAARRTRAKTARAAAFSRLPASRALIARRRVPRRHGQVRQGRVQPLPLWRGLALPTVRRLARLDARRGVERGAQQPAPLLPRRGVRRA